MGRLQLTCCEVTEVFRNGEYTTECEPDPTASVEIDGKYVGQCADFAGEGKDVPAGMHRLQVDATRDHHSGLSDDIEVPDGGQISREANFSEWPD
jgi:hypothetical protein